MKKKCLVRLGGCAFAVLLFCSLSFAAEALTDAERVKLIEERYQKREISQDMYLMLIQKYSAKTTEQEKEGLVIYGFDLENELKVVPGEGESAMVKVSLIDQKERYTGRGSLRCAVDFPSEWSRFSLVNFKDSPAIESADMHLSLRIKGDDKFIIKIFYIIEDQQGEWFRGLLANYLRGLSAGKWIQSISEKTISSAEWYGVKEEAEINDANGSIDYPVRLKKLMVTSRIPAKDVTFHFDDLGAIPAEYVETAKKGELFYFRNIWNLVPNAGFEYSGTDGIRKTIANWYLSDACCTLDTKQMHSGENALKVSNTRGLHHFDSKAFSNIPYLSSYQLTGWVKTERVKSLQLGMKWYQPYTPIGGYGSDSTGKLIGSSWTKPVKGTSGWQKVSVIGAPPRAARWVSFCLRVDTGDGEAWIDDLEFDGFGAEPVQIIESQAGYAAWGKKEIIVRSKVPSSGGDFRLIDAKTGKKVFSDKLKFFGKYTWGRYNFIADISSFQKEGEYILEATVKGVGKAKSHKFLIQRDLYSKLAQKGLEYCYIQRCGMAIPGWHDACHLDDAVGKDEQGKEIQMDLTGGWHDAGDYSKQNYGDDEIVWALSVLQENLAPDWRRLKDKLPDPLAEAWWGVDFLLKKHLGDGRYIVGTIAQSFPLNCRLIPPEEMSDNLAGTGDERSFGQMKKGDVPPYLHALAKYAQMVKSFDEEKYKRCMVTVKDLYEKHHHKYRANPLHNSGTADYVILQIILYELDPKNRSLYRERAKQGIQHLLQEIGRSDRGFLLADGKKSPYHYKRPGKTFYFWHYSCWIYNFVEAFQRYCEAFPDDEIVPTLKEEVRWFMETAIVPLTSRSPYGQMMYFDLKNPVDIWPNRKPDGSWVGGWNQTTGYNQYLAKISRVCSLAAQMLHEPEYLDIAERQIQWIMGSNPRGECMMGGIGYREMYCVTQLKGNPQIDPDASIPGGVVIGIGGGCPRAADYPRHGGADNEIHPEGFPCFGGEVWQHSTALTILACQELEYARKYFGNQ